MTCRQYLTVTFLPSFVMWDEKMYYVDCNFFNPVFMCWLLVSVVELVFVIEEDDPELSYRRVAMFECSPLDLRIFQGSVHT